MDNAFKYIKDNGGIDTEKAYPYEAVDASCRYNADSSGATDKGFTDISQGDEKKMKKALATVGPIAVAIDASRPSFQLYSEGVYYEPECSSENLDHGVSCDFTMKQKTADRPNHSRLQSFIGPCCWLWH